MNTLLIPINSKEDFELVQKFADTNLYNNFLWDKIKSMFFEKDNETFRTLTIVNAIALDSESPYPLKKESAKKDTSVNYKEIKADIAQLYENVAWLNAA